MSARPPATLFPAGMERSADLSDCGRYRFALWRQWGDREGLVNFIMLNPSTADHAQDDPTIRRCVRFVRDWGHDALVVTNLYAWRATDPRTLWDAPDPIGPGNDAAILAAARRAALVVCAWGVHGALKDRGEMVLGRLRAEGIVPHVLGMTSNNQPRHPLYIPASAIPTRMDLP